MAWIIIDAEGEPLADNDGNMILVDTEAAAREWLMRGDQRTERFADWIKRAETRHSAPGSQIN